MTGFPCSRGRGRAQWITEWSGGVPFRREPGRDVVLIATWTIREGRGIKLSASGPPGFRSLRGESYEGMVAGMSRALARLSREISEEIKTLPR